MPSLLGSSRGFTVLENRGLCPDWPLCLGESCAGLRKWPRNPAEITGYDKACWMVLFLLSNRTPVLFGVATCPDNEQHFPVKGCPPFVTFPLLLECRWKGWHPSSHIVLGGNLEVSSHMQWNVFIKPQYLLWISYLQILLCQRRKPCVFKLWESDLCFLQHNLVLTKSLAQAVIKALSFLNMLYRRIIDHRLNIIFKSIVIRYMGQFK